MRMFCLLLLIIYFAGCTEKKQIIITPKEEIKSEKNQDVTPKEIIKLKEEKNLSTGWIDEDTYTVKTTAENIEKAKNIAKHKILQDIVRIRMLNESRYTDITKISAEFEMPLKEGKILLQNQTSEGIEIYYQIREQGLKNKFERK